ncbi:MAG: Uma2 family endonuclease [Bacteroidetes bacterium]|nr:Uma2 family endonuclease [Bacteroidota bacterium]MCL2302707.1 Uma2 family endonuclease [Lentimicrobiaceae bacterium]
MNTKEKKQQYEVPEEKPAIVEEPLITYPSLDLDLTKRYTYADYLTWIDETRRELIDGFIHLMSAPSTIHAQISFNWVLWAGTFFKKRKGKCKIYYAPFDVRLPKGDVKEDDKIYNVVQPDICVVCDLTKIDDRGCIGAPDLIVEVLSPSTAKLDWNKKFNLYEKAGVREYWIVDPNTKLVHIFLLQPNGEYDLGTIYECNEKAPVHIFEGLEIDLKELFGD